MFTTQYVSSSPPSSFFVIFSSSFSDCYYVVCIDANVPEVDEICKGIESKLLEVRQAKERSHPQTPLPDIQGLLIFFEYFCFI